MVKTLKSLESLGIASLSIGKINWTVDQDCDGDSVWTTASGSLLVTVTIPERKTTGFAFFRVSQHGEFQFETYEGDIEACDIEPGEDEGAILDKMGAQIKALDWDEIAEHLAADFGKTATDEASNALYEAADAADEARDPYRYRGVSRHDFT
jgi:hypothetical protein